MEKNKNLTLWTGAGYDLYAREGMEGLQIERLARILQLNKSGFYHYFGDLEGYCNELKQLHAYRVQLFLADVACCNCLDPDYLLVIVKHTNTVMFQVQLTRRKEHPLFYELSQIIDEKLNLAIKHLWSEHLGVQGNSDLSIRYFNIIRDTFYTRVSFQNLSYQFLHDLAKEAKALVDQTNRQVHAFGMRTS